ncbi:MAG: QacE family quaternary ammonium compound efflux SMR transporter [Rhodobacter sp.]|nr:QacE family quaternary ammonium compound efflux SMR transporter [Rhodobacter sp.]
MTPWGIVAVAGLMETGWAPGLKRSDSFTGSWPSVVTVVLALGPFWLLSRAMKTLPVGTAYAVWVGTGAVATAVAEVFRFNEPAFAMRVAGIGLIIAGISALKFA